MIDIRIEGDTTRVQHCGDPVEVAIEMSIAINTIYTAFKGESDAAAGVFQLAITGCMTQDAPTWKINENQVTLKVPKTKKGDAPTGQSQGTADE